MKNVSNNPVTGLLIKFLVMIHGDNYKIEEWRQTTFQHWKNEQRKGVVWEQKGDFLKLDGQ